MTSSASCEASNDHGCGYERASRRVPQRPPLRGSSAGFLRRCLREGVLTAGEVVWSDCAAVLPDDESAREAMSRLGVKFVPTTVEATIRAGHAWRLYRHRGGPRERMVADLLIGAHALLQSDRLLSRDRGFHASYFKDLIVLDPSPAA